MMKKIINIIVLLLVFFLLGCSYNSNKNNSSNDKLFSLEIYNQWFIINKIPDSQTLIYLENTKEYKIDYLMLLDDKPKNEYYTECDVRLVVGPFKFKRSAESLKITYDYCEPDRDKNDKKIEIANKIVEYLYDNIEEKNINNLPSLNKYKMIFIKGNVGISIDIYLDEKTNKSFNTEYNFVNFADYLLNKKYNILE